MVRRTGDLWAKGTAGSSLVLITTNAKLDRKSRLVMGAGIARQARDRFEGLSRRLGEKIRRQGEDIYGFLPCPELPVGCFQTRVDWREDADPTVINQSARELGSWCKKHPDCSVHLPFPGIGHGNLKPQNILPLLSPLPDQVRVWTRDREWAGGEAQESSSISGMVYAGIGSRSTPGPILKMMRGAGRVLGALGAVLRSGAAGGADVAFEKGATAAGARREVFLPWEGFNDRSGEEPGCYVAPELNRHEEAFRKAREVHPAWKQCSPAGQKLHTRNVFQVFGPDLERPVRRVICWTPDGAETAAETSTETGGTAQAIRLADEAGIPVHNLRRPERQKRYRDWLRQSGVPVS